MALKNTLRKCLPIFRMRDTILEEIYLLREQTKRVETQTGQLSALLQKQEYFFFLSQQRTGETELEIRKRVMANLPKAYGRAREIQENANYILQRIKKICDENEIDFVLSGGTMLGAVRHHGFIPWDDDVDIEMMRGEYLKLQKALEIDEELELKRYYGYHSQYGHIDYVAKVKLKGIESYFVDVFPFDNVSFCEEMYDKEWEAYERLNHKFHEELQSIFDRHSIEIDKNASKLVSCPEVDEEVFVLEQKYVAKLTDTIGGGSQPTHFCMGIEHNIGFGRLHRFRRVSDYLPIIKDAVMFEGMSYNSYNNNEMWLKSMYGDIWSFPGDISMKHIEEIN